MATSTIVVTYNAASGEVSPRVTSFTVGGTAFGSLTATQIRLAQGLLESAAKLIASPTYSNANAREVSKGSGR